MTHERDIDRLLDHWFLDGPTEVADRVIDRCRGPDRPPAPATNSDVAAPSPSATPGPSPTTSPTPTPAPAASASPLASSAAYACDPDRTCSGLLPAGDQSSGSFDVPFTFTTSEGWVNRVDISRAYKMDTAAGITTPILVMSQVAIAEQNAACDPIAKAGAGDSVQDFVDLLVTHPGLDTTDPVPVEVGGYKGQSVDFTVASTWTNSALRWTPSCRMSCC